MMLEESVLQILGKAFDIVRGSFGKSHRIFVGKNFATALVNFVFRDFSGFDSSLDSLKVGSGMEHAFENVGTGKKSFNRNIAGGCCALHSESIGKDETFETEFVAEQVSSDFFRE